MNWHRVIISQTYWCQFHRFLYVFKVLYLHLRYCIINLVLFENHIWVLSVIDPHELGHCTLNSTIYISCSNVYFFRIVEITQKLITILFSDFFTHEIMLPFAHLCEFTPSPSCIVELSMKTTSCSMSSYFEKHQQFF